MGVAAVAAAIAVVVGAVMLSGSDATAPVGAVAAVQDDHLATESIESISTRLDLLETTGVTTTRVDLFWNAIAGPTRPAAPTDPNDPSYDFARADVIIQGLAERGITPIVSVYSTPAWSSGGAVDAIGPPINRLAPDPKDYGDFMGAVAARYSGGFAGPGGQALPEVRFYEVWNEPNLDGFFQVATKTTEARLDAYAGLAREAYRAIKNANADATVIVGVGGPRSSTTATGVGAIEWLQGLRARAVPLDGYSQHVYPSAAPTVDTEVVPSWSSIGRVLDELDAWRARPAIPLYITEAGYTTAATRFRETKVTEAQQAEYLTQIFALPQLRTDRIKTVVWFNLQDNADWPAGLLRDGTLEPKPSYDNFLRVVKDQKGARLE